MAEVATLHMSHQSDEDAKYDDAFNVEEEEQEEEERPPVRNVSVSPEPSYVLLKDDSFIEAAGLQRTAKSGRKSSVERLLGMTIDFFIIISIDFIIWK